MSDPQDVSPEPQPSAKELTASSPAPDDRTSSDSHDRPQPQVSSKWQLLANVEYLSGLVLTGLVPTARANSAHACLRTVLQYVDTDTSTGPAVLQDEDALKVLRQNPELLKILQPLLTPGQLELIIGQAAHD